MNYSLKTRASVGAGAVLVIFSVAAGEYTGANAAMAEFLQVKIEAYMSAGVEGQKLILLGEMADAGAQLFRVPPIVVISMFEKDGGWL